MNKRMNGTDVAPRLEPALLVEARRVAEAEGLAVDQLINEAIAEKLAALRTRAYFAERSARGDVDRALRILARAGRGAPPMLGDELPPSESDGLTTADGERR